MTDRPVSAFMLSSTLHGVVVGFLFLFSYVANQQETRRPRILELVAGEGDNYGARVAPALGTPEGVKLDVPTPPAPKPEPASVETPAPPPAPVPKASAPTKAAEPPPIPNFEKQIRRKIIVEESKAKREIAKERKAEEKRIADEKKKLAKMTKEEFDRQNKVKAATPKSSPPQVAKIDPEGIAKGVAGGSTENKIGGAGGKALASDNDDVRAAYDALFKQRLARAFDPPPGLSDTLEAGLQVRSNADGSITDVKIVRASGSVEFDRAVLAAVRRLTMPARPDGRSEVFGFSFSMREKDDR